MKPRLVRSTVAACLLATTSRLVGCKEKTTTSEGSRNSAVPKSSQPSVAPKSTDHKTARGLVVAGERFTTRIVQDRQQGLPVCVFQAPEKWRDNSQVVWNYSYIANPVSASCSAENPDNEEAFFSYAAARY